MAARGVYKMGTIARISGLSPSLLRAWENRHSLLDPERLPSGHRLYTEDDLAVLRRIRDLMSEGRSIGEVAAIGRKQILAEARTLENAATAAPAAPTTSGPAPPVDLGGVAEAVVEAARSFDAASLDHHLDDAFGRVAPETAIDEVILPAAVRIGELWLAGELSVAAEHLASGLFVQRLHRLLDLHRPSGPAAIVACVPDETHEIGPLVVAFHAARAGFRVYYLGATLPLEDLERACEVLTPHSVLLSVTRTSTLEGHRPRIVELLGRWSGRTRFVFGGQGVEPSRQALEKAGGIVWAADRPLSELHSLEAVSPS